MPTFILFLKPSAPYQSLLTTVLLSASESLTLPSPACEWCCAVFAFLCRAHFTYYSLLYVVASGFSHCKAEQRFVMLCYIQLCIHCSTLSLSIWPQMGMLAICTSWLSRNGAVMSRRVQISLWYIDLCYFSIDTEVGFWVTWNSPFSVLSFFEAVPNQFSQLLQYVLVIGVSAPSPAFVPFHLNGSLQMRDSVLILILIYVSRVILGCWVFLAYMNQGSSLL